MRISKERKCNNCYKIFVSFQPADHRQCPKCRKNLAAKQRYYYNHPYLKPRTGPLTIEEHKEMEMC